MRVFCYTFLETIYYGKKIQIKISKGKTYTEQSPMGKPRAIFQLSFLSIVLRKAFNSAINDV